MPIVEAVLVELDLQRVARDGDEGEVGNFDPTKEPQNSQLWSCTPILERPLSVLVPEVC